MKAVKILPNFVFQCSFLFCLLLIEAVSAKVATFKASVSHSIKTCLPQLKGTALLHIIGWYSLKAHQ